MHAILTDYGALFSPQTWSVIFKGVVFPIVDSAKTGLAGSGRPTRQQAASKQVWISTMGLKVLTVCLELYMKFRENIVNPSISDFISLLGDCICQEIEMLAKMGLEVLAQLVIALGKPLLGAAEEGVAVVKEIEEIADRNSDDEDDEKAVAANSYDSDAEEREDEDDLSELLGDDGPKGLCKQDADVVCESFLAIMCNNIFFDFGLAGKVDIGPQELAELPSILRLKLKASTVVPHVQPQPYPQPYPQP